MNSEERDGVLLTGDEGLVAELWHYPFTLLRFYKGSMWDLRIALKFALTVDCYACRRLVLPFTSCNRYPPRGTSPFAPTLRFGERLLTSSKLLCIDWHGPPD